MKKVSILFLAIALTTNVFAQMTAKDFYERAQSKAQNKDFEGALADLNSCIQLDNKSAQAYSFRARVKYDLKDDNGSYSDATSAIMFKEGNGVYLSKAAYSDVYLLRGIISYNNKKIRIAILDLNKAIEIDPNSAIAFRMRGLAKVDIDQYSEACLDFKKAKELGANTDSLITKYCN